LGCEKHPFHEHGFEPWFRASAGICGLCVEREIKDTYFTFPIKVILWPGDCDGKNDDKDIR